MLTIEHSTVDKSFMIQVFDENSGSLVCIKISGKLTGAEYKNFIFYIEGIIKQFETIKFYMDILDLDGWEWGVAWSDFTFGLKNWNKFSKIAIVGEKRWAQNLAWATN